MHQLIWAVGAFTKSEYHFLKSTLTVTEMTLLTPYKWDAVSCPQSQYSVVTIMPACVAFSIEVQRT